MLGSYRYDGKIVKVIRVEDRPDNGANEVVGSEFVRLDDNQLLRKSIFMDEAVKINSEQQELFGGKIT